MPFSMSNFPVFENRIVKCVSMLVFDEGETDKVTIFDPRKPLIGISESAVTHL